MIRSRTDTISCLDMRRTGWHRAAGDWLAGRRGSGVVILMYHRVATAGVDPWGLCVSPENFAAHLEVIRALASAVPLRRLAGGRVPRGSIVVTLDDGYADALVAAALLRARDVPATVFVATGNIGRDAEFWWDELERLLLLPGTLPSSLELVIAGQRHRWELRDATWYTADEYHANRDLRAWEAGPGTRHRLYYELWRLLFPLPYGERETILAALRRWARDRSGARRAYRTLRPSEIRALADGGLVEIGAHTVTHPPLSAHPAGVQRWEITESREVLQEIVERPVTSFSYPHGEHSRTTRRQVRGADFTCACTVAAGSVRPGGDPFRLPRHNVLDWPAEVFERRLREWLEA